ncbi:OmpA/MotB [Sulfurimonas denitrificans DSM 1251]|uniref:OmpA/MotB n=1 Tax=Sulfurimonas denitrificans (strain ATCC 33889 / DSM 1251) TaxID=326298 RepID=Q30NY9_SULDN|nr:OmpA family protein [Sulfurimonas denitrificans]ABB45292.1 OmpA/MotB [Sulfurimonas denitrificans DSM 1251]MDD3442091.1 OmpA family protein [Sulfurimonas denitrificans]
MRKLLLIPALLLGTAVVAQEYNYEITPVIGTMIPEGNLKLDNQFLTGVELQYNGFDALIKPELSFLFTNNADYKNSNITTDIYRIALNGVYEYKSNSLFTPLAKVGVGYEALENNFAGNRDSVFFDAGVGAKVALAENIALKLEAVYMLKNNNARWDNNLALLAGVNFAFGPKAQPVVAPEPVAAPAPKPVPAPAVVPAPAPKPVDGDDDKDGVLNSIDKCPKTPIGHKVDKDGCSVLVDLHINFDTASYKVDNASMPKVKEFAEFLKDMPNYNAKIVGHTDSVGSDKDNQKLSENRANSVKTLIVKEGIDTKRITTEGKGEKSPIATNDTKEGKAQNRRIEAELIKK